MPTAAPSPTRAQHRRRKLLRWLRRRRRPLLDLAVIALIAAIVGLVGQTQGTQIADMAGRQVGAVLGGLVFIVLALLWAGYTQSWADWIGLSRSTIPKDDKADAQRAKTLWDWLDLLIVPAVLAAGGLWFTQQQQMEAVPTSAAQHQADLKIADNQAKDAVLDTYMDRMSDLVLKEENEGLRNLARFTVVRAIAQARTTTAIQRLDPPRNGILLSFLFRSHIATEFILDLRGVDLHGDNLEGNDLSGAQLLKANLRGADVSAANLSKATLDEADLRGANLLATDLSGAQLGAADLRGALLPMFLVGTDLVDADLRGVDLNGADLHGDFLTSAWLSGAHLYKANLRGAHLYKADLRGADLRGADLRGADLSEVKGLTDAQIKKETRLLRGATLPSGKEYK